MEAFGPASESLRLFEHYRQLTDDELIVIAQDSSDLTEIAQQALAQEISQRKLKLPAPEEPPSDAAKQPDAEEDPEGFYDKERQLVEICTVWSLDDAVQLQTLLDQAEIPFFMGPEKATRAEAVTSSFQHGVSVQIMQIGIPWARAAMQHYGPANEPVKEEQETEKLAVRCPKCHSEDVVFEHLVDAGAEQDSPKYAWTCAFCGNHWEDEGVETEG